MPISALGVDLGHDTLKAARLTLDNGVLTLTGLGFTPLGEIGHLPESPDRRLALQAKFQQMIRESDLRTGLFAAPRVALGLAGAKVSFRFLQTIPVPRQLLEKKIAFEVSENITAKSKIALSYNYRTLDTPQPDQTNVLIGLAMENEVEAARQDCKQAQLGDAEIDFGMLGLYNSYLHGHGPCYKTAAATAAVVQDGPNPASEPIDGDAETVAIVEIGAAEIKILICNGDDLYFVKSTAGGGQRFSQSLAKLLQVKLFEAEAAKCEDADITIDSTSGNTLRLTRADLPPRPSGGQPIGAAAVDVASESLNPTDSAGETAPADELPETGDSAGANWLDDAAAEAQTFNAAVTSPSAPETPAVPVTQAATGSEPPPPPAEAVPGPAELTTASGGTLIDPAALDSGESILNIEPPAEKPLPPEDPTARLQQQRRISSLLVREAAAICANIESTVQFCRQQNRIRTLRLNRVLVTGGGARLKGLTGYMQRRMRLPVEELDPFRNIKIALPEAEFVRLKAERDRMAVPIGLAIGLLKPGAARMPVITAAESARRHLLQRSIYLYYSAVLLIAVVALGFFFAYRHNEAYADQAQLVRDNYDRARLSSDMLQKKMRDLELLRRETNAVEMRVNSGSFIASLLTSLKSKEITQDSIWFTEIATVAPDFYHREQIKKEFLLDDLVSKELAQIHANAHLLRDKRLYLRGFAKSAVNRTAAVQTSLELVDRLSKARAKTDLERAQAIFDDAWLIYTQEADPLHLPKESKNLFIQEFVIECRLYEKKSIVIETSVLPPQPGEGAGGALAAPAPGSGATSGGGSRPSTPSKPGMKVE